jgi:CRISPR-associated protein Cmr1
MAEQIEATFRIVTPMFIGGADQSPSDGIRPPSVKGALRFWWRALNWGRIRSSAADDAQALRALHLEEARLFGSAADDSGGGQGCFQLRVTVSSSSLTSPPTRHGHKYLLGLGLIQANGNYLRQALSPKSFSVTLLFRPTATRGQKHEVVRAMLAWGLLGGLGSRSRRGIGSVAIESFVGTDLELPVPQTAEQYGKSLNWLGLPSSCALPPYSAFSVHTRIDHSVSGTDAWALLDDVGVSIMKYRGWGFDSGDGVHKIAGERAEQNFPDDHLSMLRAVQGVPPTSAPNRAIFGLPHNYFFKSEFEKLSKAREAELLANDPTITPDDARKRAKGWAGARAKAEISPAAKNQTRRASPLLIHAHHFMNGGTSIIQTFLPATFLPTDANLLIKAARLRPGGTALIPPVAEWHLVHTYLDRFAGRTTLVTGSAVP